MLTAVIAVGLAGCGGDDNPNDNGGNNNGGNNTGGNNNNSGGGGNGGLVLGKDEAWVDCDENSDCEALVFTKDGKVYFGGKEGDGDWVFNNTARQYSTSGNKLIISLGGDSDTATYSISGNKLTLNASGAYTRTSGVVTGIVEPIDPNTVVKGTFTDSRDKKTYKTVKIGSQTWMAENLNYETASGSKCWGDSAANCATYGRVYTWEVAKTACPSGYHLPEPDEWRMLIGATGGNMEEAGNKLKSKSGWPITATKDYNGTDDYGFSALPRSKAFGDEGVWWTNEKGFFDDGRAVSVIIYTLGKVAFGESFSTDQYYVRCVK